MHYIGSVTNVCCLCTPFYYLTLKVIFHRSLFTNSPSTEWEGIIIIHVEIPLFCIFYSSSSLVVFTFRVVSYYFFYLHIETNSIYYDENMGDLLTLVCVWLVHTRLPCLLFYYVQVERESIRRLNTNTHYTHKHLILLLLSYK